MARKTKNLGLTIQEQTEFYDVDIFNTNFEKLDTEVFDKVKKNPSIKGGTKTKITFDEKGLVTGGEDLIPDDIPNIHVSKIEGRPPIVYVNDVPIYGSRFFDIDKSGNAVLRENGDGEYLLTVLENGKIILKKLVTVIADNLDTDNEKEALSAKQGKILSDLIKALSELLSDTSEEMAESIADVVSNLTVHKDDKSNPHSVTKMQVGLGNADNTADVDKPVSNAAKTEFESINQKLDVHTENVSNPHNVTKAQVGLVNVDNTADSVKKVLSATKLTTARKINGISFDGSKDITIADVTKIPTSQKGAAGGVAELDENGFVPSSQLPSYVDDIIEGYYYNNKFYKETAHSTEITSETGKIYVDINTDLTYRWSGTKYVEVSKSLALGETSSTAYAGNKGKKNAEDIASLKERMTSAENNKASIEYVDNETAKKVDKETYNTEMSTKSDLINGIVPDTQLPYYNKTQNIYIDGFLLYPTTFVDVDKNGKVILRADGSGEYLLYVPLDGIPRIKYMGNVVTDEATGKSYSFTVSDGVAVAKQII